FFTSHVTRQRGSELWHSGGTPCRTTSPCLATCPTVAHTFRVFCLHRWRRLWETSDGAADTSRRPAWEAIIPLRSPHDPVAPRTTLFGACQPLSKRGGYHTCRATAESPKSSLSSPQRLCRRTHLISVKEFSCLLR